MQILILLSVLFSWLYYCKGCQINPALNDSFIIKEKSLSLKQSSFILKFFLDQDIPKYQYIIISISNLANEINDCTLLNELEQQNLEIEQCYQDLQTRKIILQVNNYLNQHQNYKLTFQGSFNKNITELKANISLQIQQNLDPQSYIYCYNYCFAQFEINSSYSQFQQTQILFNQNYLDTSSIRIIQRDIEFYFPLLENVNKYLHYLKNNLTKSIENHLNMNHFFLNKPFSNDPEVIYYPGLEGTLSLKIQIPYNITINNLSKYQIELPQQWITSKQSLCYSVPFFIQYQFQQSINHTKCLQMKNNIFEFYSLTKIEGPFNLQINFTNIQNPYSIEQGIAQLRIFDAYQNQLILRDDNIQQLKTKTSSLFNFTIKPYCKEIKHLIKGQLQYLIASLSLPIDISGNISIILEQNNQSKEEHYGFVAGSCFAQIEEKQLSKKRKVADCLLQKANQFVITNIKKIFGKQKIKIFFQTKNSPILDLQHFTIKIYTIKNNDGTVTPSFEKVIVQHLISFQQLLIKNLLFHSKFFKHTIQAPTMLMEEDSTLHINISISNISYEQQFENLTVYMNQWIASKDDQLLTCWIGDLKVKCIEQSTKRILKVIVTIPSELMKSSDFIQLSIVGLYYPYIQSNNFNNIFEFYIQYQKHFAVHYLKLQDEPEVIQINLNNLKSQFQIINNGLNSESIFNFNGFYHQLPHFQSSGKIRDYIVRIYFNSSNLDLEKQKKCHIHAFYSEICELKTGEQSSNNIIQQSQYKNWNYYEIYNFQIHSDEFKIRLKLAQKNYLDNIYIEIFGVYKRKLYRKSNYQQFVMPLKVYQLIYEIPSFSSITQIQNNNQYIRLNVQQLNNTTQNIGMIGELVFEYNIEKRIFDQHYDAQPKLLSFDLNWKIKQFKSQKIRCHFIGKEKFLLKTHYSQIQNKTYIWFEFLDNFINPSGQIKCSGILFPERLKVKNQHGFILTSNGIILLKYQNNNTLRLAPINLGKIFGYNQQFKGVNYTVNLLNFTFVNNMTILTDSKISILFNQIHKIISQDISNIQCKLELPNLNFKQNIHCQIINKSLLIDLENIYKIKKFQNITILIYNLNVYENDIISQIIFQKQSEELFEYAFFNDVSIITQQQKFSLISNASVIEKDNNFKIYYNIMFKNIFLSVCNIQIKNYISDQMMNESKDSNQLSNYEYEIDFINSKPYPIQKAKFINNQLKHLQFNEDIQEKQNLRIGIKVLPNTNIYQSKLIISCKENDEIFYEELIFIHDQIRYT